MDTSSPAQVKAGLYDENDLSENPFVKSFGLGVRHLRRERGWTQERLAEHSNLNRSYIGEIERGVVIASLVTVEKLAQAFAVSPSVLILHGENGQDNFSMTGPV